MDGVTPEVQNILDTFTGADGGARYVAFQVLYGEMLKRAKKGDKDAKALIDIVHRFSRLIDTAANLQQRGGH